MPPRKRGAAATAITEEPLPKRRSLRRAAATANKTPDKEEIAKKSSRPEKQDTKQKTEEAKMTSKAVKGTKKTPNEKGTSQAKKPSKEEPKDSEPAKNTKSPSGLRAVSEDPDVDSIPAVNPNAPKHDGEWYWLMKAEPESRFENGIDVKFSIDDLRAKEKPEGWDGIRAYPARNNMRNMNVGDKAFFYHSNCKEPGIAGIMEIVKEYSEDRSARRPGTPYYDPSSTKDKPKWDLVHVEFRKKFAVPISLKELRELGKPGQPLEDMQMLKQSRLSVSKVSEGEWKALCELADKKAQEAGLEHEGK